MNKRNTSPRGTGILIFRRGTAGSRNPGQPGAGRLHGEASAKTGPRPDVAGHTRPLRRTGFTLPELLVTVAILASSLALLASAVTAPQGHGQAAQCAANMREIYVAVHQWMQDQGRDQPMTFMSGLGDFMFFEAGTVVTNLMGRDVPLENPYVEDPSVFFCPQSGMTAEEHFGLVFAPPLSHGTYIWLYSRFDGFPASQRGQGNYARDSGYERVLMVDSGPLPNWVNGIGKMIGEHYHLLHNAGGVEMYFARDCEDMATKLGIEGASFVQIYLREFIYGQ